MTQTLSIERTLVDDSRQVMATHARSFQWASVFLNASSRDDAAVVYAFCRLVDDLADEAPDEHTARRDLAWVRAELMGERPARPLIAAFLRLCDVRGIPRGAATALLDGVESDLDAVRVADDRELLRYCYRVAGTVGIMMCGVLGVTDPRAIAPAIDLGIGMQLTNICRDVREDAALGRTYLPARRLLAAGTTPEALLAGEPDRQAVRKVTADLLHMADVYYRSARDGMHFIPWRARFAIRVASGVYSAIGHKLRRNQSDPWPGRTRVGVMGKLWRTVAATLDSLSPTVLGLAGYRRHRASLHHDLQGLPGAAPPEVSL